MKSIAWILIAGLAASTNVYAQTKTTKKHKFHSKCVWATDLLPFGYCVSHVKGSKNPDVLYYMHGAGGWQDAFPSEMKSVIQYWADNNIDPPTVITMSFGPIFLLAQKNGSGASGLLEFVTDTYMEEIEAKIGGVHGRRLVMGESMGGFNTIQLVMKRPDLWAKAGILCPDITTLSPYSSDDEISSWEDRSGVSSFTTWWELFMDKIFFADDGSWNEAAPLLVASKYMNPATPPLFLSVGTDDDFGFFPGTETFLRLVRQTGASIQYSPVPGPHCRYDVAGIARFITE